MTKPKPPSNQATVASLRRLWRRVLILQVAVGVLFVAVVVLAWRQQHTVVSGGSFKPPLPVDGSLPPEEQFIQGMQTYSSHASEIFSKAKVPYTTESIERTARLEPAWLAGFASDQGLDPGKRSELGQILGEHMMHLNDVYLEEYRGAHSPKDTARFVEIEQSRLYRTLIDLLGSDGAAALQVLLEEQLPR